MKKLICALLLISTLGYGQKTDSALLKGGYTIKNEINPKANTQIRVGGQLVDMINGKLARIEKDTASGTDTYTANIDWMQSYKKGLTFVLTFNNENTTASTLNINGFGSKPLVKNGVFPLTGGEIEEGETCILHYDGTNFQIVSGADFLDSVVWGQITGSIGDQIDLTDSLNARIRFTDLSATAPLSYSGGATSFPSWPANAAGGLSNNGSGTLSWVSYLKPDGSVPLTANWDVGGYQLKNLVDPTDPQDASTKAYTDAVAQGLKIRNSVVVGTTDTLTSNTYANGTLGVGATLTSNYNGVLVIDGVAVALNDRILVKNESNKAHNGIYTVTTLGAGGTPYVLTRATDNDQSSEIASSFVFIQSGSLLSTSGWVVIGPGPFTIGTTDIEWTQFNGSTVVAGIGLTQVGVNFNVNTTQNISTLSNLTTKGIVTSTAAGLLSSQHGTGFLKDDGAGNITYGSPVLTETDPVASAINGVLYSNGSTLAAATGSNLNNTFGSQTATYVYAAPNGGAGTPSFRALLLSDLPNLSSLYAPLSRSLTINGSAQDLSADRTWTITTTGTTNRISVSGGTGLTPTIDISNSYVGQSSITTLGTIGTGVWNGTKIGLAYGGTNADLSATGGTSQVLKQSAVGGAITVGQLSYSDISGTPGNAYLLSSGGTATAANTFTFNTANWLNFTSTFTATANSQYANNWTGSLTSRGTASDLIQYSYINPTITAASTSIRAEGLNITPTFQTSSGISTGSGVGLQAPATAISNTCASMTPGTYTNVAATSTNGTGDGLARFTVIVATGSTFTSFNCTTSGGSYNVGETVTFNANLFGAGGTGSITLAIISTINSFGSSGMATLTLGHSMPEYAVSGNSLKKRYIDFKAADGTTSLGGIEIYYIGGPTEQFTINDATGAFWTATPTAVSTTRTVNVGGIANSGLTTNSWGAIGSFTGGIYRASGTVGGITAANVYQGVYTSSRANAGSVGFVTGATILAGGSSYTTGVKSTSGSATGTGCTINVLSVSSGAMLTIAVSATGINYVPGDVLNVSGGTAGTVTVTSVDYAGRIGTVEASNTYTDSKTNNLYAALFDHDVYNITTTQTAWTGVVHYDPTYTNLGSAIKGGIAIVPAGTLNIIGGAATSASATWDVRGSGSNPTLKLVGAGTGTNYTARFFQSDGTTEIFSVKDNGIAAHSGIVTAPNFIDAYSTTATAAATTTLTVSSNYYQAFTGSTTQTVALPVATTMSNGQGFLITNTSSGTVTVQTSGGNTIKAMAANSMLTVWVINTGGGTGTASWNWQYTATLNN